MRFVKGQKYSNLYPACNFEENEFYTVSIIVAV